MSAIEKFKEYFGMSPVAAYEDEYLDDYDRPVHHDIRDRRDDYGYRAESLHEDYEPLPRRTARTGLDPVDEYPERTARIEHSTPDGAARRPRRYAAAESAGRLASASAASSRSAVSLSRDEDFVDDGLVTVPETVVERPRGFGDGKGLGENFRAGRAVVLDLSSMARDDARRMVDFAAGLVFGLDGTMQKVTDRERTFLLQPAGMDLTEAEVREAVNGAFRS